MSSAAQVEAGRPERGIFDCEEAHRSPRTADYERIFRSGMVVLDTNVLLNLYRSNERTRRDTLAVLDRLRDRLWVPDQVLAEFWRNRELRSVRHHHDTKAREACAALDKAVRSAQDALDRWVTAVHLRNDDGVSRRIGAAMETVSGTVAELKTFIEGQAAEDALEGTAETHTDPVLTELEALLRGRIGAPLPRAEHDRAVQEAQRRAEEGVPPGYEDFRTKPPEQAAGDYLLWLQLMEEAKRRACDVLLVTGDVKKDWWIPRDGDIPARPRTELAAELRQYAGVGLYMLTPGQLLSRAEDLLDLDVDEGSVSDLEQLGGSADGGGPPEGGWTEETLGMAVLRLMNRYPSRVKAVFAAAANDGFVDRATVYALAGYPEERQLKGFTRPIGTVMGELRNEGVLTGEEPFLLTAVYGSEAEPSWATGFRIPDEVIPLLRNLFQDTPTWSVAVGPKAVSEGGEREPEQRSA